MAIRFKKYQDKNRSVSPVKALRITEKNLSELAAYINKNGGTAFLTSGVGGKPVRIRIKQLNFGENWGKRDWRVAKVGDFIVMDELNGPKEFFRAKDDFFEDTHTLVK